MAAEGQFGYAPPREDRPAPAFAIIADPYVMDRAKKIFPGAKQNQHGQLVISATPANARDLEWFLDRHELEPVNAESIAQLNKLADDWRNTRTTVDRILASGVGEFTITGRRQPALTPRDYQLAVPAMLRAVKGILLGDELGLGKTFSSSLIACDEGALPAAVVAPQHLVSQWAKEELPLYFPWARIHIIKVGTPYRLNTHNGKPEEAGGKPVPPPHFLIFTYGKVQGWVEHLKGKVKTVIFDEADALRTGPKTASGGSFRYEACEQLAASAVYRIGLTGTPVHNYADEMWNVCNLLQPGCLGSRDEFARTWGGKRVDNPRALGTHLRKQGILLRRTRADVGKELGPDPIEIEQPVETDSDKLAQMLEQGIVALASKVISGTKEQKFTSGGQLEAQMRKATGVAKAPYVAEFAKLVLESQEKVLLVGHHHEVQDIWMDLLGKYKPVMYGGRQSPTQKVEAKKAFVEGDSRVLVMALLSGAGLNGLQRVCSTAIFGEIGWTPPPHKQLIGRLNRDGQTTFPVMAHYMISNDGSDPVMADLLQIKKSIAHPLVDPDAELVQPSPEEAAKRTRLLAEAVLRKHGVDPDKLVALPDPEPGGALISRETLRSRFKGGGSPGGGTT